MGSSCSSRLTHSSANDCEAETISGFDYNFCTADTGTAAGAGLVFCTQIGDKEFTADFNSTYSCFYNDGTNMDRWDTSIGCCGRECAIAGIGNNCKRIFRRGRPTTCCFRDKACKGINQINPLTVCYDSDSTLRSCPTDAEDLSSDTCSIIVQDMCANLNNDPTSQWRENWLSNRTITEEATPSNTGGLITEELSYTTPVNPICQHALWRITYGINGFGCNGQSPPNTAANIQAIPTADGIIEGRLLVDNLITTYTNSGGNIFARPDQVSDTELNDLIWGICSTTPALCVNSLKQLCINITTADLIANPNYQRWCSCYMSPVETAMYQNLFNIPLECTPVCNQKGVIPAVSPDGITLLQCKQSTCVIDNISIDLYKSRVGNGSSNDPGIVFSQICGSCGGGSNSGSCHCQLSNLSITAAEASLGGIDLSQQCSNSTCYTQQTASDGSVNATPIPCASNGGVDPIAAAEARSNAALAAAEKWKRTKILIIFIIIIFVLAILWFIFAPRDVTEQIRIYTRDYNSYNKAKATS
jgi:hypothetical protein